MSFCVRFKSHVFGKHYLRNKETFQTRIFQELKRSELQMIGVFVHGLAEFLGEFIFLTVKH